MDSYDSLNFFMWVAEKINAKSQKFKKLQLFSSLKNYFSFLHIFRYFTKKIKTTFFKTMLYLFSSVLFNIKNIKLKKF